MIRNTASSNITELDQQYSTKHSNPINLCTLDSVAINKIILQLILDSSIYQTLICLLYPKTKRYFYLSIFSGSGSLSHGFVVSSVQHLLYCNSLVVILTNYEETFHQIHLQFLFILHIPL